MRLVPAAGTLLRNVRVQHIGRKKKLQPSDFLVAVKGCHLKARHSPKLGVDHKRLVCQGHKLVKARQSDGFQECLEAAKRETGEETFRGKKRKHVHANYNHMWDEVACKFKSKKMQQSTSLRTTQQIIVQRGRVTFGCMDTKDLKFGMHSEVWLCEPKKVAATKAKALFPALSAVMPRLFNPKHGVSNYRKLLEKVDSATLCLLGDKASANVLIQKAIAKTIEEEVVPELGPKVLVMLDTCCSHLHHRIKLVLRPLKKHTMRHFGIANLLRLSNVRDTIIDNIGRKCKNVVRIVGPPPGGHTLLTFVDILYKLDAPHHKRKGDKDFSRCCYGSRILSWTIFRPGPT